MGKSSINGPFSMAMLNNQRVICLAFHHRNATDGLRHNDGMIHGVFCVQWSKALLAEGEASEFPHCHGREDSGVLGQVVTGHLPSSKFT